MSNARKIRTNARKIRSAYAFDLAEDLRISPTGSREVPVYSVRIDSSGRKEVYQSGARDLYEIIQASLEQSKVQNIVRRALGGDPTALAQRYGTYMDVTAIPNNMIDISNLALRLRSEFDSLPADLRQKFDNSVDKFVSLYGTPEWSEMLGLKKEIKDPSVEGPMIDGGEAVEPAS